MSIKIKHIYNNDVKTNRDKKVFAKSVWKNNRIKKSELKSEIICALKKYLYDESICNIRFYDDVIVTISCVKGAMDYLYVTYSVNTSILFSFYRTPQFTYRADISFKWTPTRKHIVDFEIMSAYRLKFIHTTLDKK